MHNDSTKKTLGMALVVCLVCSILVSTAAVTLKSIQKENQERDKLKNILDAGNLLKKGVDIKKVYQDKIQPEIIELATGQKVAEGDWNAILNPESFDIKALAGSEKYGRPVPAEKDLAQIRRMPKFMVLYRVRENGRTIKYILPVYGKGLWSTMYGFIALDTDVTTIRGFTFYEHGETPGLGGEVDNPRWKQIWVGKQAYDVEGRVKIRVIKGRVDPSAPEARFQIDGLSGSTLTTRGVDNLVRFWLGPDGYGPTMQRLREEGSDYEKI